MTKHIGTGLLALAATASIAMANGKNGDEKNGEPKGFLQGVSVTAAPGSGITIDGGDSFALKLKNQFQYKWTYMSMENAANTNTFDVRRARTALSGHVFNKNIKFMLKNDWEDANGRSIKDAWVHWNFINEGDNTIGVRLGQTKTQFGRSATGSSASLEMIERDTATLAFADTRSRGIAVHGQHMPEDKLHWSFGIYNATTASDAATNRGEEGSNDDNELNFVGTVRFDPMGDMNGGKGDEAYQQADLRDAGSNDKFLLSVGAGVEIANGKVGGVDVEGTSININAAAKVSGVSVLGEVFLRSDDPAVGTEEDATGFNIQGSYTLAPAQGSDTRWGGALRITSVSVDDAPVVGLTGTSLGAASGDIFEIGFGVNAFYKKHNMKTQVNYTLQQVEPDGAADRDNHIIDIMFTLIF